MQFYVSKKKRKEFRKEEGRMYNHLEITIIENFYKYICRTQFSQISEAL